MKMAPLSASILEFVPYTEEELEKVIEQRIRKNAIIRRAKTAGRKTASAKEKATAVNKKAVETIATNQTKEELEKVESAMKNAAEKKNSDDLPGGMEYFKC